MYNTEFVVKYKQIERELSTSADGEYADGTFLQDAIMDEIYRQELIAAFGVEDIDDPALYAEMGRIWELVQNCAELHRAIRPDGKPVDELAFTMAFQYNTFWALHPCLCALLKTNTNTIDALLLEPLADACKHTSLQYVSNIEDDIDA